MQRVLDFIGNDPKGLQTLIIDSRLSPKENDDLIKMNTPWAKTTAYMEKVPIRIPTTYKNGGWLNQYQDGGTSDYDMLGYATHHPLGALKHMINPEKFHGTDEYKRPNHLTFSDESKYSNTEHTGGHWSQTPDGKWTFTPTEFNIQNAGGPEKYQQWWDETEGKDGNILILPQHKRGGVTWLNEYQTGGETFQYYTLPNGKKVRVEYTNKGVSHYDPVTQTISFNQYDDPSNPEAVLQHEGMHAWQDENGEMRIDTPESYGPLKRPNMVQNGAFDEVLNYFNRRPLDEQYVTNKVIQKDPEFRFVPDELLYNGHGAFPGVNELMYRDPNTVEGGARDYEYAFRRGEVGRPVITSEYKDGGKTFSSGGEKHKIYKKESPTGNGKGVKGHIMVTHPTMDKGEWDTIDLTEKSGAKTVAEGIAATRKWHEENPEYQQGGPFLLGMNPLLPTTFMTPKQLKNTTELAIDAASFVPALAVPAYFAGLPFAAYDTYNDVVSNKPWYKTAADAAGLIPGIKYIKRLPASGLKKAATVVKDLKMVNNAVNLFNTANDAVNTYDDSSLPPGTMLPQVKITPKKQKGGWLKTYK
jgi:hypothetical protein